jgi:hypothetical protein
VRTCKEVVEQPDGTGSESGGSEIEVVSDNAREATRQNLKGLL